MSWISFPVAGGRFKIKRRWDMRRPEREREVWVLNLDFFIVTWWSRESLESYRRNG